MSQLAFFHSAASSTLAPTDLDLHHNLVWTTCQRQVIFVLENAVEETRQLLSSQWTLVEGIDAEAQLLEILCGLQSAVIAETEILGQFRDFLEKNKTHAWTRRWFSRSQLWLAQVKEVREKHLCGTGSQSYGSYLRRALENVQQVDILGAGSLVRESLPWLSQKRICLRVRDQEKAHTEFSSTETLSFSHSQPLHQALIVAAPLSHEELQAWIETHVAPTARQEVMVFDLRRDARDFSTVFRSHPAIQCWIDLDQVMAHFESQRAELELKVRAAQKAIELWRLEESAKMQIRPFGWEDLCG
jgi:glutamyl-tRNA reductase